MTPARSPHTTAALDNGVHSELVEHGGVSLPRLVPAEARSRDCARSVALLGVRDLDGAEPFQRAIDEENLHRDVGLDVRLAEEREDLAAGQRFDLLPVLRRHHALEVLTHRNNAIRLAAVHDRLLARR